MVFWHRWYSKDWQKPFSFSISTSGSRNIISWHETHKTAKIFYLQNEMEYDYIRERVQQLNKLSNLATENLIVTKKMKLTLNEEGIEKIKDMIAEKFDLVDLIVIDSLHNSVGYRTSLQHGIEELRSKITLWLE